MELIAGTMLPSLNIGVAEPGLPLYSIKVVAHELYRYPGGMAESEAIGIAVASRSVV